MQLLSLLPILILLLYLLVSKDLVYAGLCELVPEGEQLLSKIFSNCSGAETTGLNHSKSMIFLSINLKISFHL